MKFFPKPENLSRGVVSQLRESHDPAFVRVIPRVGFGKCGMFRVKHEEGVRKPLSPESVLADEIRKETIDSVLTILETLQKKRRITYYRLIREALRRFRIGDIFDAYAVIDNWHDRVEKQKKEELQCNAFE